MKSTTFMEKCEDVKQTLSHKDNTTIRVCDLIEAYQNTAHEIKVTRSEFNDVNKKLFTSTMDRVDTALASANLEEDEMQHVILTGGSSRIPKIRELLLEKFDKSKIIESDDIEELGIY